MNWKPKHAAAVILPGVQFAELGISLMIMMVQRAKLIEGLSDSEGQQEQLGQERQMGQEITGNLHTKENIENFSENTVPTSPNVSSEDVPDSPFTMVSTSGGAFLASYCPPDLKLKRTVRTERTVFPGIREEPSVNRQRLHFGGKQWRASVGEETLPRRAYQLVFDAPGKEL